MLQARLAAGRQVAHDTKHPTPAVPPVNAQQGQSQQVQGQGSNQDSGAATRTTPAVTVPVTSVPYTFEVRVQHSQAGCPLDHRPAHACRCTHTHAQYNPVTYCTTLPPQHYTH